MWSSRHVDDTPEVAALRAAEESALAVCEEAQEAFYAVRRERDVRIKAAYERIIARYDKLYADRLMTAHDALQAATIVRLSASCALRASQYPRGLAPISDKNNGGECIIAPDGTVYMIPEYQDHSDVFDAVCPDSERHALDWLRVTANGTITHAYKGYFAPASLTNAQCASLDQLADLHAAAQAPYDSGVAERIRLFMLTPPPDADEC